MSRMVWSLLCAGLLCSGSAACNGAESGSSPAKPEKTAAATATPYKAKIPEAENTKSADKPAKADEEDTSKPRELKLDGLSFLVPAGWKQVPPAIRLLDAEFSVPQLEGDEYPGRLTMMAAGGEREGNISRWKSQFQEEDGNATKVEKTKLGDLEITFVDIRGDWKGGEAKSPLPPGEDYRLLGAIVAFGENSSYYIKLIGPKATVGNSDEAFRKFVKSIRIVK